jgi:dsRNA-specific ribonuclease
LAYAIISVRILSNVCPRIKIIDKKQHHFTNFIFRLLRCVNEGGPAHAKRFTFAVRVNTTDRGWTDECVGEPMPSVKKAKDSAAVLLLELLNKRYS